MIELHSSDLTNDCLRRVQLKRAGKYRGEVTGALYKGILADEALVLLHEGGKWAPDAVAAAVVDAVELLHIKAREEHRPLSEAVRESENVLQREVQDRLMHYADRLADHWDASTLIGTQLPVRFTMDDNTDNPIHFASHLDLLYRSPDGELVVADWKYNQESPDMAYLGRNMQLACYHLAVRGYGEVCVDSDLDQWVSFDEHPRLEWYDLARFKPYARATGDFQKGDDRPLKNIVRSWYIDDQAEALITKEIRLKNLLIKNNIMPMSAGRVRCMACESKDWCHQFNREAPLLV